MGSTDDQARFAAIAASTDSACAPAQRADLDLLQPARQPRHGHHRRGRRRVPGFVARHRLLIAQAEGVFDTTGVFAGMTVLAAASCSWAAA
jgi:hypothetical protein